MNFQNKTFETAANLRGRATSLTEAAVAAASVRARLAADRVAQLQGSLATLQVAGRAFTKMSRRHLSRFVKQNSSIARDAGKEVASLARSTYQLLSAREAVVVRKPRKSVARKRAAVKAS